MSEFYQISEFLEMPRCLRDRWQYLERLCCRQCWSCVPGSWRQYLFEYLPRVTQWDGSGQRAGRSKKAYWL